MGQGTSVEANDNLDNKPFDPQEKPEEDDDYQPKYDGPFVQILYGSQTKNGMNLAYKLAQRYAIKHSPLPVAVSAMDQFEPEHLPNLRYLVFIVSTHTDGRPAQNAKRFMDWLLDATQDFRLPKGWLNKLKYTVVGLGSSDYKRFYNSVSKDIRVYMKGLGAKALARPCLLDYSDSVETKPEDVFEQWCLNTLLPAVKAEHIKAKEKEEDKQAIAAQLAERRKTLDELAAEGKTGDNDYAGDDEEEEYSDEYSDEEEDLVDVEDMGTEMDQANGSTDGKPRKMLSDRQYRALTKQGYKIVGSHSGVKLCRWTKAMLRGRGGCYKHTFYGIISYLCMEMTPSLACANKCTFCWRHHTNPVGRSWQWEMDPPKMILDGALDNHRKMINVMKGAPGVQPQRFVDAMQPKHCALSLVGEPIMYPEINKFLHHLHEEDISSFIVTNAQFPEEMKALTPVTQLYLSIDGHTPETLKEIDRPLNEDFWERFIRCQEIMNTKKQRTVYRLTLVKGFNMADAVRGYAKLVSIGNPTFIEVKGVTFCGPDGGLTMNNVPYHEEVKQFCEELCKALDTRYELACEHRHSCCILISDVKMKKDGQWHTWIDYPKFQQLVKRHKETGEDFTDMDYSAPTPAWAVYGSEEAGFSPNETRYTARGKNRDNLKNKQPSQQPDTTPQEQEQTSGGTCGANNDGEFECCGGGCQSEQPSSAPSSSSCCNTDNTSSSTEKNENGCCGNNPSCSNNTSS